MPRVDAAPHRDEPHPFGHVGVDDAMYPLRRGQPIDAERCGDAVDRRLGRGPVEPAPSAQKTRRVEIAQHQVGVGDRRLGAALAVAGRPRSRAGARRADMQDAAVVDPRNRAAAGADAGDVEAVERDRVAGDAAAVGQARAPIDDQRNVGAGAAHVERDQIALADQPGRVDAAGDPARRPGQHGARRQPARLGDRRHPAMRLDDQGGPHIPGFGEPLFEAGEIARHGRPDIGIDHGRRDPLEFLDLRQHLGRQRDISRRQLVFDCRARRLLVARVAPCVQVAHRHRLDPLGLQDRDRRGRASRDRAASRPGRRRAAARAPPAAAGAAPAARAAAGADCTDRP